MQSRAKGPTKAEKKRMEKIVEIGCVCCRMEDLCVVPTAEIHHLIDGGVRRGHRFTVGLCDWHHRGVNKGDFTLGARRRVSGPSLAEGSRPFHERYGSDDDLLAYQNTLLASAGFKGEEK